MKQFLLSASVLAMVSVSTAKTFTTTGPSKRNPAQTVNIGPASTHDAAPATIECVFTLNGSNGEKQSIPLAIKGSEATGDLEAFAKPVLGGGSDISASIRVSQVLETSYGVVLWLTDDVTGVQTLHQDFLDFPATMQTSGVNATLLFKNARNVSINGKKVKMSDVSVGCSLIRKNTI